MMAARRHIGVACTMSRERFVGGRSPLAGFHGARRKHAAAYTKKRIGKKKLDAAPVLGSVAYNFSALNR